MSIYACVESWNEWGSMGLCADMLFFFRSLVFSKTNHVNRLAEKVMRARGIPVYSTDQISPGRIDCSDGVHRFLCSVSRDVLTDVFSLPLFCGDEILNETTE